MQHADVGPEDWWLDTLIDELEANDLDVLGVAIPIKDNLGLTSIALDRPDGDTWRPLCRLSLAEVYRLPETFTSEHVGHPLLLNTGLWVCRFDESWARKVRFTINDRIPFNRKAGRYEVQCEPEDWYFSRLCHERGLKVGCTRKVKVKHRGPADFTNDRPWGEPFDSGWLTESVLPKEIPGGFDFPHDVDGWLLWEEGKALADLAVGKRVLEIGSYCGKSTICMARGAVSVTAIDPHDGRATPKPKDTLKELGHNLEAYGVAGKVDVRVGTVDDYAGIPVKSIDFAFIDGAHDYESVKKDIAFTLPRLTPGALLAFHDYRSVPGEFDGRWDPGVTRAVHELIAAGGQIVSRHATLAVVRPPAAQPLEV